MREPQGGAAASPLSRIGKALLPKEHEFNFFLNFVLEFNFFQTFFELSLKKFEKRTKFKKSLKKR